jgi:hypothetical protein
VFYAETSYLASREALGASKNFERFEQIVMGWLPLPNRVTLGARANYAWSSDGTPFFLRPFIQLRGVPVMRYQGEKMGSVEVETRWPVSGRWSGVVFGGAGSAPEPIAMPSTERRTSAAAAWAFATRWRASSEWMSVSTWPAARNDGGVSRGGQRLVPAVNRCFSPPGLAKSAGQG